MVIKKCPECGKEYKVYNCLVERNKFCSKECYKKHKTVSLECNYCGKQYIIPRSVFNQSQKHYCSMECRNKSKIIKVSKKCENCGEKFISYQRRRFCSQNCSKEYMVGENAFSYRDGSSINNGYKVIREFDKYVLEHRKIAENIIGRPLKNGEVVHHIDFNKKNNDPSNLIVMEKRDHDKLHTDLRHSSEKRFGRSKKNTTTNV